MDVSPSHFSPWNTPPDIEGDVSFSPSSWAAATTPLPRDRVTPPRCSDVPAPAAQPAAPPPDAVSALFSSLVDGLQRLLARFGFGGIGVAAGMPQRPPPHFPAADDPRYRAPH